MFIKQPKKSMQAGDDNLIPLINIVFLMLIFFMVAGKISKADPVDILPLEAQHSAPPPMVQQTIYILADGSLNLNDKAVDAQALEEAMRVYKTTTDTHIAGKKAAPIAIKADKLSHAKDLDKVVDILQTVGTAEITLYSVALNKAGG